MILLDTHAAIWLTTEDDALGRESRALALRARDDDELAISAISFWEIALLVSKGRLRLLDSAAEQREIILGTGILEIPVTGEMSILAVELKNLHGDPADRIIAATAIACDAVLMTADEKLLAWRHALPRQNASQ